MGARAERPRKRRGGAPVQEKNVRLRFDSLLFPRAQRVANCERGECVLFSFDSAASARVLFFCGSSSVHIAVYHRELFLSFARPHILASYLWLCRVLKTPARHTIILFALSPGLALLRLPVYPSFVRHPLGVHTCNKAMLEGRAFENPREAATCSRRHDL